MLQVECLTVGPLAENTYLIYNDEGNALIIDPGAEADRIRKKIEELHLTPQAILVTHTHHDHIGAVAELRELYNVETYVHEIEADTFQESLTDASVTNDPADVLWTAEDMGKESIIGDFDMKIVFVPGHSPGHVAFIFPEEGFAVTGDTVFQGSIGRTDLPGGSFRDLMDGIVHQLLTLPDKTILYPGHGKSTTVGDEKDHNPFLQEFIG